jgi:hypothetical protein
VGTFGDEGKVVVTRNVALKKNPLEGFEVLGVDDEEFVFIELDFAGVLAGQGGDSGTAIVGQQVLEIAEMTHEDGQIDVFAEEVLMRMAVGVMAGFENDVNHRAQGLEKLQEDIEEVFGGDGGGEDGDLPMVGAIAKEADAVALAGGVGEVMGGADGLGEAKAQQRGQTKVKTQFFRSHIITWRL